MFKTFRCLFHIFWIMDVMNMPFMEQFDTTYPLNGLFWLLAIIIVGWETGFKVEVHKNEQD